MDTSFDAFGAGGWGGDQADEFLSQSHRSSSFEKLVVPVSIKDLVANTNESDADQETYKIGSYAFRNVRVIGRVANCSVEGGNVVTYELIPYNGDMKTSRRFTVIRTLGDDHDLKNEPSFGISTIVHANGLLRIFNNRISILSFDIRESSEEEAEQFNRDTTVAKYYYKQNMPDLSVHQMDGYTNSFFCPGTINKSVKNEGGVTQSRGGYTQSINGTGTQKMTNPLSSANRPMQPPTKQMESMRTSQLSGLSLKQQRIFQYIEDHTINETGVSKEEIMRALNLPNVNEDISQLLGDGRIYSTIDDDHFAPINNQ